MYDAGFGPLVNSMWTYAFRTGHTLLSSPVNTPLPPHHFTPFPLLNPVEPLCECLCEDFVSCECSWRRMRDFFEVSLQGGNLLSLARFLSFYVA
jgi:hypothetical protein